MSFEIYVQWFDEGAPTTVPREPLAAALAPFGADDGIFSEDEGGASGLSVGRPPDDPQFWSTLFDLMQVGHAVFFFAGSPPIIRKPEAARHLPEGMEESMGAPVLVSSSDALCATLDS